MDKKYMVWLSSSPGVGLVRIRKLIEHFGSPQNVWESNFSELRKVPQLGEKTAKAMIDWRDSEGFKDYLKCLNDNHIGVLLKEENDYPRLLSEIFHPPEILYVRGRIDIFNNSAIAIIGSRNATYYGKKMAEEFAYNLARAGVTIVSGMARGVDTYAHKGALAANGSTIAVLGSGVNVIYPPENAKLYYDIIKNGAVISEFSVGTKPAPGNFPVRNRIISGLAMGVLVIEAGEKSGSLITVDYALEQGKDVFAIPGNVNSRYSSGTNGLIKQGAKLVSDYKEILEEFAINEYYNNNRSTHIINDSLKDEELLVLNAIEDQALHVENIIETTGYSVGRVASILTSLEIKGLVVQQSVKVYIKT